MILLARNEPIRLQMIQGCQLNRSYPKHEVNPQLQCQVAVKWVSSFCCKRINAQTRFQDTKEKLFHETAGAYDDEEAAARAYDLAALKYWSPGTLLNFKVPILMTSALCTQHIETIAPSLVTPVKCFLFFSLHIQNVCSGKNEIPFLWQLCGIGFMTFFSQFVSGF